MPESQRPRLLQLRVLLLQPLLVVLLLRRLQVQALAQVLVARHPSPSSPFPRG